MLVTLLYVLFFLSCIVLVATILLQPGKADAGALFTSNISSTAFGPRGTQSILSRITIATAFVFVFSALLLSMPAVTGEFSVLNSTGGGGAATQTTVPVNPQPETNTNSESVAPAAAAETNANSAVPANTAANTNAANNK